MAGEGSAGARFRGEGAHSCLGTMRYCAAFRLAFAMLWGEGGGSFVAKSQLA